MAHHISTKQIVDYIKTVPKISVDGIIYSDYTITESEIIVDKYSFPLAYFDIGGMNKNSLVLVDTDREFRRVQFHDENNVTLNHPKWELEEYDSTKITSYDALAVARQKPFDK